MTNQPTEDAALSPEDNSPAERLRAHFGAEKIATTDLRTLAVDGSAPDAVVMPESAEETAAVLLFAKSHGLRVFPMGGGTRRGLGNPPRGIDIILSTARLGRVLAYEPADFVITIQSGMTLAGLREATSPYGQWLALDPPALPASTVGGVLSADASGPHRYLYGTARDLIVGLEAALPNGTVVRSGGRVVKNVAGYDLKKIFIGALGSLGVITSISLKLHAIAEEELILIASFSDYRCAGDATADLLRAGYEIAALDLLNRQSLEALGGDPPVEGTRCALLIAITGTAAGNEAQASEIAVLCARSGSLSTRAQNGEASREIWRRLGECCSPESAADEEKRHVAARISVPVKETAAMAELAESAFEDAGPLRIVGRCGNGALYLLPDPAPSGAHVEALGTLRAAALARGGSLVIEEAPPAIKRAIDVWGAPVPALPLHRKIKQAFDPSGTLVPGRFVDGL